MATNREQQLDRLYTGLIHVHYALLQFYRQLDVGNIQQRRETRFRLYQAIQELGRLINSLKPLIALPNPAAEFEGNIKIAADTKLTELSNRVDARIAEIIDWAVMMRANEQDRKSMVARIRDLARMFHEFKNYLNIQETNDKIASLEEIIKFADYLDEIGAFALADALTESVLLVKRAYVPKIRGEKKVEEEQPPPIQAPHEGSLSTRYCPDHHGVQAIRVAERTYQCPIDGKLYNYETGYINYQGQQVPGGSIAAQTPISSDYGGIPMRVYDSRQSVLNRLN